MRAVQFADRPVGEVLHPGPEVLPAGDLPRRVGVKLRDRLLDCAAGNDQPGDPVHLRLEPEYLAPSPGVGLVEIDRRAEELARRERVPVAADSVVIRRQRQQISLKEPAELCRRRGGSFGSAGQVRKHRARRAGAADQPGVETPVWRRPVRALPRALDDLAARRNVSLARSFGVGALQVRVSSRDSRHTRREIAVRFIAFDRHQVEDLAHALDPAGNDIQIAGRLARVVQLDSQAEPLQHRGARRVLALGARLGLGQGRDRRPVQLSARGETRRAQVGHLVVMAGDARPR